jgi:hypothetical protein
MFGKGGSQVVFRSGGLNENVPGGVCLVDGNYPHTCLCSGHRQFEERNAHTFYEHCHDDPSLPAEYLKAQMLFQICRTGNGICGPHIGQVAFRQKETIGDVQAFITQTHSALGEIAEIISEGLVTDSGCMVIQAFGDKDGKKVKVETHVQAPGLVDSFQKAGITAEMYLTGQGGFLFSKLFLNDCFDQVGLISPDMLSMEQVDTYFDYAKELEITLVTEVTEQE